MILIKYFLFSISLRLSFSRREKIEKIRVILQENSRSSLQSNRILSCSQKKKKSPYDERRLQETRFVRCTQNEVISVLTEPRVHHACNFDILHNFCRVDIGHDPSYPFSSLLFFPLPFLRVPLRTITDRRIPFSTFRMKTRQLSFENVIIVIFSLRFIIDDEKGRC